MKKKNLKEFYVVGYDTICDGNNYVLCKDVAYGSEDMYVLCGNSSPQFVDPEEFMIVFFTHTLKD